MKTRSQRIKQQQEGIPTSPPLQLPNTRRPSARAGRATAAAAEAAPTVENPAEARAGRGRPTRKAVRKTHQNSAPTGEVVDVTSEALTSPSPPPVAEFPSTRASHGTDAPAGYSLLHLWVDPTSEDLAPSRPASDPTLTVAFPSAALPGLMAFINRQFVPNEKLTISAAPSPSPPSQSRKRKLSSEAVLPSRKRGIFSRMPLQPSGAAQAVPYSSPATDGGRVQLVVGAGKDRLFTGQPIVAGRESYDAELSSSDKGKGGSQVGDGSRAEAELKQPVSRWGLASILGSARSMSRYLPGLARLTQPPESPAPHKTRQPLKKSFRSKADIQAARQAKKIRTTRQRSRRESQQRAMASVSEPIVGEKRTIIGENETVTGEKETVTGEKETVTGEKETVTGEKETVAGEKKTVTAEKRSPTGGERTITAKKRKRKPSPDTIPNPPGTSYGLDLAYFGWSSSDEEEEEDNQLITPTRGRPSKSRRLSTTHESPSSMRGAAEQADPYVGAHFADEDPSYHGGNVFEEILSAEEARREAAAESMNELTERQFREAVEMEAFLATLPPSGITITNLEGSFRVPDPSDSDSDPEDSSPGSVSRRTSKGSPTSTAAKSNDDVPHTQVSPPTHVSPITQPTKSPPKVSETWKQPPPPRPTPSHAALPPVAPKDSEALARARAHALKHKPLRPSSLRTSSRVSSPQVIFNDGSVSQTAVAPAAQNISDTNIASIVHGGQMIAGGNTSLVGSIQFNSYADYRKTIDPKVAALLDSTSVNSGAMGDLFNERLTGIAHEMESTISQAISRSIAPTPTRPAPTTFTMDPKVEAFLNASWTKKESEMAGEAFNSHYKLWLARQNTESTPNTRGLSANTI